MSLGRTRALDCQIMEIPLLVRTPNITNISASEKSEDNPGQK